MASSATQFIQAGANKLSASARQQNQRALARRNSIAPDVEALRKAHKPWPSAFIMLGVMALALDCVEIFQIPIDATVIGAVVLVAANLIFFFCVRAFLNRSPAASLFLSFCLAATLISSLLVFTAPFSLIFVAPVVAAGIFNPRGAVITRSKENLLGHVEQLEQGAAQARRRYASLLRFGRSFKATRTVSRNIARTTRTFTKRSKTIMRWVGIDAAKIIPIVGMIPFQVWGVYATYQDQKKQHQEAQELLADYARAELEQSQIDIQMKQAELQRLAALAGELQDQEYIESAPQQILEPMPVASMPPPEPAARPTPPVMRDIQLPAAA